VQRLTVTTITLGSPAVHEHTAERITFLHRTRSPLASWVRLWNGGKVTEMHTYERVLSMRLGITDGA
jgi:hypothetical protein